MNKDENETTKSVRKFEFDNGCMWEGDPWKILIDFECSGYSGRPCKHCHSIHDKIHTRRDESQYVEKTWICPRVVFALNEGGHNSTGVCLDCILEAAAVITNRMKVLE